jgi:hypothetical protein
VERTEEAALKFTQLVNELLFPIMTNLPEGDAAAAELSVVI